MNKNKNNSASLISGNATKAGAKINPIAKKNKDSVEIKNGEKIQEEVEEQKAVDNVPLLQDGEEDCGMTFINDDENFTLTSATVKAKRGGTEVGDQYQLAITDPGENMQNELVKLSPIKAKQSFRSNSKNKNMQHNSRDVFSNNNDHDKNNTENVVNLAIQEQLSVRDNRQRQQIFDKSKAGEAVPNSPPSSLQQPSQHNNSRQIMSSQQQAASSQVRRNTAQTTNKKSTSPATTTSVRQKTKLQLFSSKTPSGTNNNNNQRNNPQSQQSSQQQLFRSNQASLLLTSRSGRKKKEKPTANSPPHSSRTLNKTAAPPLSQSLMLDRNGLKEGQKEESSANAIIRASQAAIQKSRDHRLRQNSGESLDVAAVSIRDSSPKSVTGFMMQSSPQRHRNMTHYNRQAQNSPMNMNSKSAAANAVAETAFQFEETMRDEAVFQLQSQLDEERKKHREMKDMFDETLHNMEQQKTQFSPAQTPKSIKAMEAMYKLDAQGQIDKYKITIEELKQRVIDQKNDIENYEKKLIHAQMREKEAAARDQLKEMQQEAEERRLKFDIDKFKEKIKDLISNEEQLKSDHAQTVLELNDQIQEARTKQAQEDEEDYVRQITEIRQTHARERDNLIQLKFAATKELQLIKLDHSELIRNTNFEEQRELASTITAMSAQIEHLTIMLNDQRHTFNLKESQMKQDQQTLEAKLSQLQATLDNSEAQKSLVKKELMIKNRDIQEKLEKANEEKEKVCKSQMQSIQENIMSLKSQIQSTNQSLMDQSHLSIPMQPFGGASELNQNVLNRLNSPDFDNKRLNQRESSPYGVKNTAAANANATDDDQVLQNSSKGNNNSFMLDVNNQFQHFCNNYYIEYAMLQKLQALTNNFTCQKCWQVLNFQRFFDEDHECPTLVRVQGDTQFFGKKNMEVRGGEQLLDGDSIEEINETNKVLQGIVGSKDHHNTQEKEEMKRGIDLLTTSAIKSKPTGARNTFIRQRAVSTRMEKARNSHPNLPSLMRASAKAVVSGVMVTQIQLPQSRNAKTIKHDSLKANTISSIQSADNLSQNSLDQNDFQQSAGRSQQLLQRRNTTTQAPGLSNRQKVNAMQLEVYVKKVKDYRAQLDQMEIELKKCKKENEILIDDLCDTKTKVAVLEENKAQLQMELTKERKKNSQKQQHPQQKTLYTTNTKQVDHNFGGIELRKQRSPPPRSLLQLSDNNFNNFYDGNNQATCLTSRSTQNMMMNNQPQQNSKNNVFVTGGKERIARKFAMYNNKGSHQQLIPPQMHTEPDQQVNIKLATKTNNTFSITSPLSQRRQTHVDKSTPVLQQQPESIESNRLTFNKSQSIKSKEKKEGSHSPRQKFLIPLSQKFSAYPQQATNKNSSNNHNTPNNNFQHLPESSRNNMIYSTSRNKNNKGGFAAKPEQENFSMETLAADFGGHKDFAAQEVQLPQTTANTDITSRSYNNTLSLTQQQFNSNQQPRAAVVRLDLREDGAAGQTPSLKINKNNHKSESNFLRAKNLDEDKHSDVGPSSSINSGEFDDNESCELSPELREDINSFNNRDGDNSTNSISRRQLVRTPNGGKQLINGTTTKTRIIQQSQQEQQQYYQQFPLPQPKVIEADQLSATNPLLTSLEKERLGQRSPRSPARDLLESINGSLRKSKQKLNNPYDEVTIVRTLKKFKDENKL